jgi:hypothetical protein
MKYMLHPIAYYFSNPFAHLCGAVPWNSASRRGSEARFWNYMQSENSAASFGLILFSKRT